MAFGSVQTAYSINTLTAYAGMLADMNDSQRVTGICKDPGAAAMPAGIMVAYLDTPASDQIQLVDAVLGANAQIAGIIIHTHAFDSIGEQTAANDLLFKDGATVSLLTKGRIYVQPEAGLTIVQGDPVYLRYVVNGGNTQLGSFSNVTDAGKNYLLKGARFESAAAAGTVAILSFDINVALN